MGEYLDLALALKDDDNPQVLDTVLDNVASVRSRIATEDEKTQLNGIVRRAFEPVWAKYGVRDPNEGFERQQLRASLFLALGLAGDPAILDQARTITSSLLSGGKVQDDDLVDAAVELSAGKGDEDFYERILLVSEKTDDPGLQSEAQETLAEFEDPALVVRTLEYATSGKVRNQDSWVLIAIELSRAQTREIAWPWVQQHWDAVRAQLTTSSGAELVSATGSFCTTERRDEVQRFFAGHPVDASERSLAKAVDSINDCVRVKAEQEPHLREWLAKQGR